MNRAASIVAVVSLLLTGCGFRVPDVQEVGTADDGQKFVQAILTNINCEMREALNRLREANPGGTFIDTWGVQTTLTLTHDEKGKIAPNVLWSPIGSASHLFTLAGGINFSADATRTNKINGYYLVSDLMNARCPDGARPGGPFLLQSDLKLTEWLFTSVSASMTRTIDFGQTALAVKENALQHAVKFEITTGGSITPSWILKEVSINPSGEFFNTSRTRTHDLVITFAAADKNVVAVADKRGRTVQQVVTRPSQQGAELHFSTLLSGSIERGVRNGLGR